MNAKTEHRLTGMVSSIVLLLAVGGVFDPAEEANAATTDFSYIEPITATKVAEVVVQDIVEVRQLVVFPSDGGFRHLSSGFGYRTKACALCSTYHMGADFTAGYGTPVRATSYGKVIDIGWDGADGFRIKIQHSADYSLPNTQTIYAHLIQNSNKVHVGDWVEPGQVIAKIGQTGVATAPHLHFQVEVRGVPVDPVTWLKEHHAK